MQSSSAATTLQVKSIHHVSIVVQDLQRSRAFYCDLIGMTPIDRPNFPFPGLWFAAGETELHLILAHDHCADSGYPNENEKTMAGRAHHFAFAVEDAFAAVELLQSRGVRIMGGPKDRGDGAMQAWFYDPDGHVVEVFHLPKDN